MANDKVSDEAPAPVISPTDETPTAQWLEFTRIVEGEGVSVVERQLDALAKVTTVSAITLGSILAMFLSPNIREFKLFAAIGISRESAGLVLVVISPFVALQVRRLLATLRHAWDMVGARQVEAAIKIQTHPWFLNPFPLAKDGFDVYAATSIFLWLTVTWGTVVVTGRLALEGGMVVPTVSVISGLVTGVLHRNTMRAWRKMYVAVYRHDPPSSLWLPAVVGAIVVGCFVGWAGA